MGYGNISPPLTGSDSAQVSERKKKKLKGAIWKEKEERKEKERKNTKEICSVRDSRKKAEIKSREKERGRKRGEWKRVRGIRGKREEERGEKREK